MLLLIVALSFLYPLLHSLSNIDTKFITMVSRQSLFELNKLHCIHLCSQLIALNQLVTFALVDC